MKRHSLMTAPSTKQPVMSGWLKKNSVSAPPLLKNWRKRFVCLRPDAAGSATGQLTWHESPSAAASGCLLLDGATTKLVQVGLELRVRTWPSGFTVGALNAVQASTACVELAVQAETVEQCDEWAAAIGAVLRPGLGEIHHDEFVEQGELASGAECAPRNSARNYSARNSPTVASRPNRRHAETASEARRLLGVVASSKLPDDKAPPASGKTASAKVEQVNVASARAVLSELRVGGGMDATVIVERVVDIQRTFRGICGAIRMAQLCAQFSERRVGSPAGRVVRLAMEEVKPEAEKPLSLSAARDARDSYLPK